MYSWSEIKSFQIVHLEKTGSVKENEEEAFSNRSGFGSDSRSGFEDFFRQWDYDARSQRGQRRYGGHYEGRAGGYQEQFHPNPAEAKRWMKQAQADLNSAHVKR